MLSVRLSPTIEKNLNAYCKQMHMTKSQVVQEALAQWLSTATKQSPSAAESDLSFLSPDDPIRAFIGIAKDGMSADDLMRMTRGDDWNTP
ncbi:MAG: hypothetical protein QE279_12095 [Rhodoferax sp.]|nr:hypothetical protein [Rhodoferax sp.]